MCGAVEPLEALVPWRIASRGLGDPVVPQPNAILLDSVPRRLASMTGYTNALGLYTATSAFAIVLILLARKRQRQGT